MSTVFIYDSPTRPSLIFQGVSVSYIIGTQGGAKLTGAKLNYARLEGTNMTDADVMNAELKKVNLRKASLSGANFKGADLQNADLQVAHVVNTNFEESNLQGVENLTVEQLCGAMSLYNAKLDQMMLELVKEKCPDKLENPRKKDDTKAKEKREDEKKK